MSGYLIKNRSIMRWLALVCTLAGLGGVIAYNLYTIRRQTFRQEQQRLMTQARVIGKNIEHQLTATSLTLQGVIADLRQLSDPAHVAQANKRMSVLANAMPGVRTLFFTDAKGIVLAANRPELIGRNVTGRQYFTEPRQHPNPEMLYISPPFRSVLNAYVFDVTRSIPGPDGRFNGIVTAGIDPEYFETILESTLYAPDMWNTINHGDGLRFMTVPYREGQAGKDLAVPGSLFTRHKESGKPENIFTDTAYFYFVTFEMIIIV